MITSANENGIFAFISTVILPGDDYSLQFWHTFHVFVIYITQKGCSYNVGGVVFFSKTTYAYITKYNTKPERNASK